MDLPIKYVMSKDKNGESQPFFPFTSPKAVLMGGDANLNTVLKTHEENVSDEFSETKAYAVGDYCIYQNRLYKFTVAKEAGPFDGTKVVPCALSEEIRRVDNKMSFDGTINIAAIKSYTDDQLLIDCIYGTNPNLYRLQATPDGFAFYNYLNGEWKNNWYLYSNTFNSFPILNPSTYIVGTEYSNVINNPQKYNLFSIGISWAYCGIVLKGYFDDVNDCVRASTIVVKLRETLFYYALVLINRTTGTITISQIRYAKITDSGTCETSDLQTSEGFSIMAIAP